ncbi:MAG TPA: EAL domain-containing protein [Candidatus Limnocylindria bacterium]|nr:EAL domain-containing protein [Candidatus Limnocylindria bacterium]
MTTRVAAAVGAAVSAGLAIQVAAGMLLPGRTLPTALIAVGGAVAVGLLLVHRAIAPLERDRDELQVAYEEAVAEALMDPLTKLGNHRAFQEELDRQTEAAQRYGVPLSLVLIDLDGFKTVNDTLGHAAGDKVLARFGRLLELSVRRPDRSFRVGGDEFALLLPHTDADGAWVLARRLLSNALQPVLREMGDEPISFSAGVSAIPSLAPNRDQLYLQADGALYAAKRAGRTEVLRYEPSAATAPSLPAEQTGAIWEVATRRLLRPVYQPIVELADAAVLGYEGLIRPAEGTPFTGPGDLFAAAEATGHVVDLDLACLDVIIGGATGLPAPQFLSVNLSAQTLEAPEFGTASLLAILQRHGMPPDRIVIELTEHRPLRDPESARVKFEAFRRLGIRFAADDLGAGNAGLRLLAQVRFDVLKVDLSLVQRSGPGAPSNAVIGSVVGLATQTEALVIAEGLEHESQVSQVATLGVRAGQGYLLGRPGPLPEFARPRQVGVVPMPTLLPDDLAGGAAWRRSIGLSANA